jgi:hypothetical protein
VSIRPWEAQPVADELDPRVLRYFVAVAEELHLTHAATRLYVAQQALSRDIRRLEQQLGVYLFTRTTRRVTLIPRASGCWCVPANDSRSRTRLTTDASAARPGPESRTDHVVARQ